MNPAIIATANRLTTDPEMVTIHSMEGSNIRDCGFWLETESANGCRMQLYQGSVWEVVEYGDNFQPYRFRKYACQR